MRNAVDRMAMQSDLRDLYQSVRFIGFANQTTQTTTTMLGANSGVIAELALQLSDNDDQRHLLAVFRDYLRANNNSVGGTDLFSATGQLLDQQMDVYGKLEI